MNSKVEEILNNLTGAALELQSIVDSKQVDSQEVLARDWLSYKEALDNVQQAIAQLKQLDISTTVAPEPLSHPKKSLMARLREIQIEGEGD